MEREEAQTRPDPALPQRFADQMGHLLGPDFPSDIILAVSGGSDSMAMLLLAHGWARHMGVRLWVVTVDHGLRAEAAQEAAFVKAECEALGVRHTTLRWTGWDGTGNLQAMARFARYDLIDRWRGGIQHVLVAQTEDDVAETFVMRLARGSGVEGLSAIEPWREMPAPVVGPHHETADVSGPCPAESSQLRSMVLIRPLLAERRAALRAQLRFYKTGWVEDASNQDTRFDRVKTRQALPGLEAIGLSVPTLARTARRMSRAKEALQARAYEAAQRIVTCDAVGDVLLDRSALTALDDDTALRLMAEAVRYVSSDPYRPRSAALEDALDRASSGGRVSLHGCLVTAERRDLRVSRELVAVEKLRTLYLGGPWDKRWWPQPDPAMEGFELAALGEKGAAQLGTRPDGIPYQSLIAQPAVFDGERLVAFVPAGFGSDTKITLIPPGGPYAAGWGPLKRGH